MKKGESCNKSQHGTGNTTRSERVLLKTRREFYTGSQRKKTESRI